MIIALADYKPFDYTREMLAYGREKWSEPTSNLLEVSKKVIWAALTVLALIPTLVIDFGIIGVSLALRFISHLRSSPAIDESVLDEGDRIDEKLRKQLLADPYPGLENDRIEKPQFLKNAIDAALLLNEEGKRVNYLELIVDDGAEDNPPINVYTWIAEVFVSRYLIATYHHPELDYVFRLERELATRIEKSNELKVSFARLSENDRAAILLKANAPEKQIKLSRAASDFYMKKFQPIASALIQDQTYLREIYGPAARQFKNI